MPLSIKDPEADQLARNLAQRTGETITQTVIAALRERLAREQRKDETHRRLGRGNYGYRQALRRVAAARCAICR